MREVLIDLGALRSNVKLVKQLAKVPVLAVVKGNAYGHGLVPCAKAAIEAGADYLGVALLEEAIILREAGVTGPILAWLLPPGENYQKAVELNIELGVSSLAVFDQINAIPGARIHLEVESGMGRGGFLSEWPELLNRDLSKVVGIFTHFASANHPDSAQNQLQLDNFERFVAEINEKGIYPLRHVSNTAALFKNEPARYDMVRVGIAIYGLPPFESDLNFQPVMKVRSKLVLVKEMPANHPIGYSALEYTKGATKIGIVGMGYADGIPRNAKLAGITFEGKAAPIIGRNSMDQFVVDLGIDSSAKSGDWVTVIGEKFDAYAWAEACQTITYEITTGISGRITRTYLNP